MPTRPPRPPHRPAPGGWNGEFYANFGHDAARSWYEARKYSFFSAGYGPWYVGTLYLLAVGDRIWVNAPGYGYVGVGRVMSGPITAAKFEVATTTGPRPALDMLTEGTYHREFVNDDRACSVTRIPSADLPPRGGTQQSNGSKSCSPTMTNKIATRPA
jgi:hypothetical protein